MQLLRQYTQQLLSVCFENCFDVVPLANTEPDFQYIFLNILCMLSQAEQMAKKLLCTLLEVCFCFCKNVMLTCFSRNKRQQMRGVFSGHSALSKRQTLTERFPLNSRHNLTRWAPDWQPDARWT